MKVYKITNSAFCNKFTPKMPKLKKVNPKIPNINAKKQSNIYNLLLTEKLVGSSSEVKNYYENVITYSKNNSIANKMLTNINKESNYNNLNKLYSFINNNLNEEEIDYLFTSSNEFKILLKQEDIEKTEELIKIFIDKLNKISTNKAINEIILDLLSEVNIFDFNLIQIKKPKSFDMETSVLFNQIESNLRTNIKLYNPIFNDINDPAKDLKDTFNLREELIYSEPFILQKNTEDTNFSRSNYIFVNNIPCLYPMKNEKNELVIKHLTNIDWINENIKSTNNYKDFTIEYLKRALNLDDAELKFDSMYFYPKSIQKKIYIHHDIVNETVDFVSENVEDSLQESKFKKEKNKNKGDRLSLSEILEDEHFINLRKKQIDDQILSNLKENIYFNGLIKLNSYEKKLNFLNTGAAFFGVKIFKNVNSKILDADFVNLIKINNNIPGDINPEEILTIFRNYFSTLNPELGFEMASFNHNKVINTPKKSIIIRMNSFLECLKITNFLRDKKEFKCNGILVKPEIKYYNGYFVNAFDISVKNSVSNMKKILAIRSDYANKDILKII